MIECCTVYVELLYMCYLQKCTFGNLALSTES